MTARILFIPSLSLRNGMKLGLLMLARNSWDKDFCRVCIEVFIEVVDKVFKYS